MVRRTWLAIILLSASVLIPCLYLMYEQIDINKMIVYINNVDDKNNSELPVGDQNQTDGLSFDLNKLLSIDLDQQIASVNSNYDFLFGIKDMLSSNNLSKYAVITSFTVLDFR